MTEARFEPLADFRELPNAEMRRQARECFDEAKRRRTVRDFSADPVPREVIEHCLRAAGRAPSGANRQPWHFVVVSQPEIKKKIREAAEKEERRFYSDLAPPEWLEALAPLGTDDHKPFLETAPYLIVIFSETYGFSTDGTKFKNYYVGESVGIATGMLINSLHRCGLATLTHTPAPMRFLNALLDRPKHEKPFLILVVGLAFRGASASCACSGCWPCSRPCSSCSRG